MAIIQDPILKINGKEVKFVSTTFEHSKGLPKRNTNVDSGGGLHVTEDVSTAKGTISFELYSNSDNEEKFREWIDNGTNNLISFSRGNLNSSGSNMTVINADVKIKYGTDESFLVEFEGNPIVE